ncbi:hypothetical protein BECAL_01392 [Bellilinea caldifistulae]|uniref:DUF2993 domain-containing protein n=1 Tax=Bellilinea caldifistulae TaxID=360411 RepID=A0A0P6X7V2_9CHLR|nr:hypothetical protein [Bellilinea caldifistulae]KPL71229.1 hypothetical protein AC812_16360 [Bellilinea caldifistulae]GAP10229.1 hypothetical protein BECAL_01392 [Bellilinea caldifistulae]
MNQKKRMILIVGMILMLVSLACNLSLQDGKLSIPITLKEDTIKQIISTAQSAAASQGEKLPLIEVEDIEFVEPDRIVAKGQYQALGGQRLNGQVELKFSVVNDQPKVEVTAINIPGVDLASDAVKKVNEALSKVIRDQVNQAGEGAVIKSITVEADALKILVEVTVRR